MSERRRQGSAEFPMHPNLDEQSPKTFLQISQWEDGTKKQETPRIESEYSNAGMGFVSGETLGGSDAQHEQRGNKDPDSPSLRGDGSLGGAYGDVGGVASYSRPSNLAAAVAPLVERTAEPDCDHELVYSLATWDDEITYSVIPCPTCAANQRVQSQVAELTRNKVDDGYHISSLATQLKKFKERVAELTKERDAAKQSSELELTQQTIRDAQAQENYWKLRFAEAEKMLSTQSDKIRDLTKERELIIAIQDTYQRNEKELRATIVKLREALQQIGEHSKDGKAVNVAVEALYPSGALASDTPNVKLREASEPDWLVIAGSICLQCNISDEEGDVLPSKLARYMKACHALASDTPNVKLREARGTCKGCGRFGPIDYVVERLASDTPKDTREGK